MKLIQSVVTVSASLLIFLLWVISFSKEKAYGVVIAHLCNIFTRFEKRGFYFEAMTETLFTVWPTRGNFLKSFRSLNSLCTDGPQIWRECKSVAPWLMTKKCVAESFFFPLSSTDSCNMKWLAHSQNCLDGELLFLISKCWGGWAEGDLSALIKSRCAEHSVKERFVPETAVWNLKAGGGNRCERFWIKLSIIIRIKCYLRTKCR